MVFTGLSDFQLGSDDEKICHLMYLIGAKAVLFSGSFSYYPFHPPF